LALESVLATARDEMRLGAGGVEGPLRVGGSPLAVVSIIPDALARLAREAGRLRVEVREAAEEALLAALIGQELDLVVSGPDWGPAHPEVLSKPLFRTRMILVTRPGHPLARDPEADLARLGSALWVLPPPGKGSFRTHVEAQFLSRGLSFPSLLIEADPFAAIIELVRRTDGVTLLSDPIVQRELAEGAVVGRPLRGAPPPRTFHLRRLAARPLSGLAERFVRALEATAPAYDQG
jgi:DNA-binding transcriptional LysR family regulator